MRRALPLHMMAPGASCDGTLLAKGALSPSEVAQRIKEVMEPSWNYASAVLEFVYPVPGHPPMRSKPGYIAFISFLSSRLLFNQTPNPLKLILK